MANLEIIALNTSTPQLLAPQAGDGYKATLTWNNVATTYTGMLFDLTNTASASGSTILDMKVGGSSVFNVTPSTANPGLTITNSSAATLFSVSNTTIVGTRTVQLTPSANTSALTVGSFALSGANAQSMLDLAGTWNTSGTPTAIKLNVTDTASNAASLLLDLQTGGTSRFNITKNGGIRGARGNEGLSCGGIAVNFATTANAIAGGQISVWDAGTQRLALVDTQGLNLGSDLSVRWSSTTSAQGAIDLTLSRKAAANLQLGAADAAAPVAQTLGVQSVLAGTTDTAGANFTIRGSQGTGTGAGGSIIFQTAPAGTTGSAQNALSTALTIASSGAATFNASLAAANSFAVNTSFNSILWNGALFGWSSSASVSPTVNTFDLILSRKAAANLQLGAADAAAPVAQTLGVQSVVAGTTNTAGANFTIRGSQGTGTGAGGSIIFQTAAAGGSGTAQNVLADRLTIDPNGDLTLLPGGARGFRFTGSNFFMRSTASIISMGTDGNFANPDLDLRRVAAGILRLSQNGTNIGSALELLEQTAPAAPAANQVRIYAEDDGAGKTRLMALFATGAAQQIAIEP